jgi:hypothetical protein
MIPIRSNLNKENCSPVSSNCVIWQGEDLSCINLCNGDTISDVVYKLAVELCAMKSTLNLTDLDLKCLVDNCLLCPDPEKTLGSVLQLLIDKVCTIQELVDLLGSGTTDEVIVRVAQCFKETFRDSNGDYHNDQPISEYVKAIAVKVCDHTTALSLLSSTDVSLQNQIDGQGVRITSLENKPVLTVVPICTSSNTVTPVELDVALTNVERAFCTLRTATGLPGDILTAIGDNECQPVAPQTIVESLVNKGTALWTGSSTTLAETIEKMWLAVCDLRGAVKLIQDTCCQFSCSDIIIDFDVKFSDDNQDMTLFFLPKSTLPPAAFVDCKGTTRLEIVDGNGTRSYIILTLSEIFADQDALQNGFTIAVPGAIDPKAGMTISGDVCLSNGEVTCVKCISVKVAPNATCCVVTATEPTTIVYKICTTTGGTTTTTTAAL